MPGGIEDRARFDIVRYANCWEDADLLSAALRPAPGRRILSVASGGDNSLALAAAGAEVVAADLSPAQLAVVELKMAAIRRLEREEVLAFLGIRPSDRRDEVYRRLAGELSAGARAFWDGRPEEVRLGIAHAGRFERYFHRFRRWVLPLIHGRGKVERLLAEKFPEERRRFYEREWDTLRWRLLFRFFFSRFVMGRLGRDPEFFRQVSGPVAPRILARAKAALTELPTHDNPWLSYILRGNFGEALPRYLQPEHFARVRDALGRVRLELGAAEEVAVRAGGGFDGFNLSDIFEYMPPGAAADVYGRLLDSARPGARLAYWNMLAPRSCPPELAGRVQALPELAAGLFARDRAFFYSAFVVEEVVV